MKAAAQMGAYIEFIYYSVGRPDATVTIRDYADAIKAIGPEQCILSSCRGQACCRSIPLPGKSFSEGYVGMR